MVSNNFPTYFSLLPPLVAINCQACFSIFPLVFTTWSTYFSIIPISFSNLFQYVKQWLSSLYPLVFSEHFHRRSLFKNALLGLIWHSFGWYFAKHFFLTVQVISCVFYKYFFPEMVVQDDQSTTKKCTHLLIRCPKLYFIILPLVLRCLQVSKRFQPFTIGFKQLPNLFQHFEIGFQPLFNIF